VRQQLTLYLGYCLDKLRFKIVKKVGGLSCIVNYVKINASVFQLQRQGDICLNWCD
jgi:hypothetical protein